MIRQINYERKRYAELHRHKSRWPFVAAATRAIIFLLNIRTELFETEKKTRNVNTFLSICYLEKPLKIINFKFQKIIFVHVIQSEHDSNEVSFNKKKGTMAPYFIVFVHVNAIRFMIADCYTLSAAISRIGQLTVRTYREVMAAA